MKLSDDEKAMLDGKEGPACRKAMQLLVRYGEALGAERTVVVTYSRYNSTMDNA